MTDNDLIYKEYEGISNKKIILFTTLISDNNSFEELIHMDWKNCLDTHIQPNAQYFKGNQLYNMPFPTQHFIFPPYTYWRSSSISNPLETNILIFKFQKPLNKIFLDTYNDDLSELFDNLPDKVINYINNQVEYNKDITLEELNKIQPINTSETMFGTFVKNITPDDYIDHLVYKNGTAIETGIKMADYILKTYNNICKNVFGNTIDNITNFNNKELYYKQILQFINQPQINNYIRNCPEAVFNILKEYC